MTQLPVVHVLCATLPPPTSFAKFGLLLNYISFATAAGAGFFKTSLLGKQGQRHLGYSVLAKATGILLATFFNMKLSVSHSYQEDKNSLTGGINYVSG